MVQGTGKRFSLDRYLDFLVEKLTSASNDMSEESDDSEEEDPFDSEVGLFLVLDCVRLWPHSDGFLRL